MNKFYLNKLETILKEKFNLSSKDAVLVAFSGGPDSVFLLYALKILSQKIGFKLGAAHLNHCLRGEDSDEDEIFCKNFAKEFKINFYIEKKDIKKISKKYKTSLEDAGRRERYSFFYKILKQHNYNLIATAHHKDDNVEQILMNFVRGCGIKGLCGIPETRDKIIRPLLGFEKNELLSFLKDHNLNYRIDKTNFENDFLRNKIRNIFIPMLEKEYNPLIKKGISNLSEIAALENNFIEEYCKDLLKECCKFKETSFKIDLNKFRNYDKAVKRRILRNCLKSLKGELLKIELSHVDDIIKICHKTGSKEVHLPDNIMAEKYFNTLEIKIYDKNPRELLNKEETGLNFVIDKIPKEKIELKLDTDNSVISIETKEFVPHDENDHEKISLNPDQIDFPIIIRTILPGDRFKPKNFNGRKKLKKIISEKKLSKKDKKRIVVMESNQKIYWISGITKNHFDAFPLNSQKSIVIKRILR